MIRQDSLLKDFFSSNDHFIDLFNAKLFDGENVLKPERCREINTVHQTKKGTEKIVDLAKVYEDVGILSVFVIENQSTIDYSMVI